MVLRLYGKKNQRSLISMVYGRHPWYSVNSELPHFRSDEAEQRTAPALAAVYTAGYEGNSIDRFLDRLMKRGIYPSLTCVRIPSPVSTVSHSPDPKDIAGKLGFTYHHYPELSPPST